MEQFPGKGGTPGHLRRAIEADWNRILKKLHIVPSSKLATLEEKISYVLQNLKKDQSTIDARQHLTAVVSEVVGQEYHKEILELIEGVELKTLPHNDREEGFFTSIAAKQHYGATERVFPERGKRYPMGHFKLRTSHKTLVVAIGCALLLLLAAVVATIVLTLVNPPQSGVQWVQEGDTIMLAKAKSLLYKEFVVTETLEEDDSDHSIDAWVLPCANLKERSKYVTFRSRSLYLYYETFLLGEQPSETPIYLLAGSQIIYSFLISTNFTLSTNPEFFIFDSVKAFQSFIRGKMEGVKSAVYCHQLAVGTPQNPALTELSYTVKHNGYYFMTGYSESGISYQFNATEYVRYLNTSDYGRYPACQLSTGQTCSFVTDSSLLSSNEQYCLLAHINQPYSEDPPSTHIEVETNKRYEVLLIPGALSAIGVIAIVVLGLVAVILVVARRRRVYGYIGIQ